MYIGKYKIYGDIDHSALLPILNTKKQHPTFGLKKCIEVLSQCSFKVKFLGGKDMTVSDFLSSIVGHESALSNEIIVISFQIREQLNNTTKLDYIIEA